ncbi:MAG: lactate utilization protein [Deltaproteobacteria bacterium]|nr:lactate utilization protein [Deltaproteobacteria bacterium]
MGTNHQIWLWEKLGEKCTGALKKNGFDAHFFPTGEEAKKGIMDMISGYETFGVGGSDTVRSLGIVDELESIGKTIYDHWKRDLSQEESMSYRLNQGRCDCFLCSANAISITGEIVNIDGAGNRVAASIFGPKKVVIIAGMNKVTTDLDSAMKRAKEVAAPLRAKDLNIKPPCVETGICSDCHSPQRICNVTVILHRKPMLIDVSVVLVSENLGY